jgi:hypothetical protein
MCRKIIITFVLIVSLVVLIYYRSRIERFTANKYLDTMDLSNEMFSKFCKKLRVLDKPNEFNLLLIKMRNEEVSKNKKLIDELVKEINEIQRDIINSDISLKNIYKLDTHLQAQQQGRVIDKAMENIKNRGTVIANLV